MDTHQLNINMQTISREVVEEIKTIIRQVGEMALTRRASAHIQLKSDQTPFTDIELEMEAQIIPYLQSHFPDHQIITEENGIHGTSGNSVWALDPVDGTKVFLNGLPNWGVSLGLLVDGSPTLGFFYMPATGEFYWGGKGFGAFLNETNLAAVPRLPIGHPLSFFAVPANAHRYFDFDFPSLRSFGSTAAHLCYVAQGIAIGALTRRVNLWDLAGVLPILAQTGIKVEFLTKGSFSTEPYLNTNKLPEELLVAPFDSLSQIRSGIRRKSTLPTIGAQ